MRRTSERKKVLLELAGFNSDTAHEAVKRAAFIHKEMTEAISNFHTLYESATSQENVNSHAAEDLLRAMLLFAGSGLDAVFKQLINDALAHVIERDPGAQREFQKFAERRIRKSSASDDSKGGAQASTDFALLAELLVSTEPRKIMLKQLTRSLTSDSLQSRDQLLKAASYFAIGREDFMPAHGVTDAAFKARNQITHEMDADLASQQGRRKREYHQMIEWCQNIVAISEAFLSQVAARLSDKTGSSEESDEAISAEAFLIEDDDTISALAETVERYE
ncbi:hypothetical protein [Neorhizobium sp. T7_12]|uniref:hypothetical protein n=1 Tax=Neorhizobium sp. T7_12 TaxID=2093832 RepID=UPI000CFA6557|nr:hypothetical protein [Neorhizobium sp. T7_12]